MHDRLRVLRESEDTPEGEAYGVWAALRDLAGVTAAPGLVAGAPPGQPGPHDVHRLVVRPDGDDPGARVLDCGPVPLRFSMDLDATPAVRRRPPPAG